jgi:TDG/mug DNA glycosylase family protein
MTVKDHQAGTPWRPTKDQLRAAKGKGLSDLIARDLRVLFCGINPGLYSAAIGHHFGRPGNRFWPALHASGFTERLYSPFEEHLLLGLGIGLTNLVNRATVSAAELSHDELREGGRQLVRKILRYEPYAVAVLGISAYRVAFGRSDAQLGKQPQPIGSAQIWVLPSPSGLNAHFTPRLLARSFKAFRASLG